MHQALAELFAAGTGDPLHVLRWMDLYGTLERAAARCADVGEVLEAMAVKYA